MYRRTTPSKSTKRLLLDIMGWACVFCFIALLSLVRAKQRKLSPQDHEWQGKWKTNTTTSKIGAAFVFVHIPKTAGSSFLEESVAHLPVNSTLTGNHELDACNGMNITFDKTSVFLRSPRSHVYSQFLECKYDGWGKKVTNGTEFPRSGPESSSKNDFENPSAGFEEWLRHVSSGEDDFRCYHPHNMQTRYMSCSCTHHYCKVGKPELSKAKQKVKDIGFLGIADFYTISVCAFEIFTSGGNTKCYCPTANSVTVTSNSTKSVLGTDSADSADSAEIRISSQIHNAHYVPRHSLTDLTPTHLKLIDDLTKLDDKLYKDALQRFWIDVEQASKRSGVDLKCLNLRY